MFGTVKKRIRGWFAAGISSARSADLDAGHSMLDCPEQTHTSPTITFPKVIFSREEILISKGPPARIGSSFTIHRPSASARGLLLPVEVDPDLVPRRRRPPYGHGHFPLEDHVVAQHPVGLERGGVG